ncbi:hypothetical protein [Pseudorhodoplanes sp.]|uniref:hypothetical protein n=1 Tax=Pseudorhodoplanes sp. TaxID=1934341 RepID=UPI003D0AF7FE
MSGRGLLLLLRILPALLLMVAALLPGAAFAAPPASCAHKFIGTWTYSGGTTVVKADGTAYPQCFSCVRVQNWTCQGDTYLFSNSGPPGQFTATLIAPNRMQGSGIIATRTGGAPQAAASPRQPPSQRSDPPVGDARSCLSAPKQNGSDYTISSHCPNAVYAVYRSINAERKCEHDILRISKVITGDTVSYFNTPPRLVRACYEGRTCNAAALRQRYGKCS